MIIGSSIIFIIDRLTKYCAEYFLSRNGVDIFPPFCNLTLTTNKGAAFGLFAHHPSLLALLSAIGIVILVIIFFTYGKEKPSLKLPLTFIIGGAAGNLFDRVYYGQVIDFIDCDFPDIVIQGRQILGLTFPGFSLYRWPAFNIADTCICIGIGILFILTLKKEAE